MSPFKGGVSEGPPGATANDSGCLSSQVNIQRPQSRAMHMHTHMHTRAHAQQIPSKHARARQGADEGSFAGSARRRPPRGPPAQLHGVGHPVLEAAVTVKRGSHCKWVSSHSSLLHAGGGLPPLFLGRERVWGLPRETPGWDAAPATMQHPRIPLRGSPGSTGQGSPGGLGLCAFPERQPHTSVCRRPAHGAGGEPGC